MEYIIKIPALVATGARQEYMKQEIKYRVHRLEVKSDTMQYKLEQFLNKLDGEALAIIPNVKPTFQLMGATSKVDFLLIVEKLDSN